MGKTFYYLTQCKAGLPLNYSCLKSKDHLILSYRSNTPQTDIFYPNSTWTTGRNKLFEMAIQKDYDYYVFIDEDLNLSEEILEKFENILNELDYPIIVPNMWGYNSRISDYDIKYNRKGLMNDSFKIQTIDWFDGAFNAFNKNSIQQLLPYECEYDATSWWYSQLLLILKSNFLFKNKIVQINEIYITNQQHSSYPRNMKNVKGICNKYIEENSMETLSMSNAIEIKQGIDLSVNENYPGYKKILHYVSQMLINYKVINFIDVGVANGMILKHMIDLGMKLENINSIGIDPLLNDYYLSMDNNLPKYNKLINHPISLKDDIECEFFVQKNISCSSLNKINIDYISTTKKTDNFYLPDNRKDVIITDKVIKVNTKKLSTLIKDLKLDNEIIHFLKIDAQGQDLNVIKSCEEYLKNVLFIMVETTMPTIKNGTLYKDSSNFMKDNDFLENNNFKLLTLEKLLESDADALYYNKALIDIKSDYSLSQVVTRLDILGEKAKNMDDKPLLLFIKNIKSVIKSHSNKNDKINNIILENAIESFNKELSLDHTKRNMKFGYRNNGEKVNFKFTNNFNDENNLWQNNFVMAHTRLGGGTYRRERESIYKATNLIENAVVAEIGVQHGYSSIGFLDASPKIYAGFDLFFGSWSGPTQEVLKTIYTNTDINFYSGHVVEKINDFKKDYPNLTLDVLFIDGLHDYDSPYNDTILFLQNGLIDKNTTIIYDDYHFPKLKEGINKLLLETNIIEKVEILDEIKYFKHHGPKGYYCEWLIAKINQDKINDNSWKHSFNKIQKYENYSGM